MSETISLPMLISRLSKETGADANTSRIFVREFFATIAETLATGATLEIPGLGTFRKSTEPSDDGEPRVLFQPDSSLATDVNAPFAMFDAREVPENVTDSALKAEEPAEEPAEPDEDEVVEDQIEEMVDSSDEQPLVDSVEILEDEPGIAEDDISEDYSQEEDELPPAMIIDEEPLPEPEPEPETLIIQEPESKAVVESEINLPTPETIREAEKPTAEEPKREEPEKEELRKEEPRKEEQRKEEQRKEEPKKEDTKKEVNEEPVPSFPEDDEADDLPLPEPTENHSRAWIWILIAALVVGIAAGVYFGLTIDIGTDTDEPLILPSEQTEETATPEALPEESASSIAPAPSDASAASQAPAGTAAPESTQAPAASASAEEPVYETIGRGNYLSTIARRHYGSDVYWVYIYEANADKIRNPDNVPAGIRVVVPPKSSFPPAANEAEARAMAERKAREIRNRR